MKKIANLLMLLAVAMFVACDDSIDTTVSTVEVKPYNLEGVWKLSEVDGNSLAGDTYVYVVLDRKCGFEIYQNTASMYPVLYSGTFKLTYEWRHGNVISGVYDYEQGKWEREYVISDLLHEKSMTWTSKTDTIKNLPPEVQKFVYVDKVPQQIIDAARKPLE